MRFLQIATFYSRYLHNFYIRFPDLIHAPYTEQIDRLVADGFGGGHLIAPYMPDVGYESALIIANALPAQARWARDNGLPIPTTVTEMRNLAACQIEAFRPDILYIHDPLSYESSFLRALSHKSALIIGWRAATIPPGLDWTSFDLMLSSDEYCRRRALDLGARAVEHFHPGFPAALARAVADEPKQWDLVFCGQASPEHQHRMRHLAAIGQACRASGEAFRPGFFLGLSNALDAPPEVAAYDRGAVWGLAMCRTVRSGRIGLNFHIDMAEVQGQNMRVLETTGCGAFLLTEASAGLATQFVPGREVETYRDGDELLEKIRHYLQHPDEREAIARRGQERCLADHSMERRAAELDSIVRRQLAAGARRPAPSAPPPPNPERLMEKAISHFQGGQTVEARTLAVRVLALRPDHGDALHLTGLLARRRGDTAHSLMQLGRALTAAPATFPTRWVMLANLAAVLNDANRWKEALATYTEAEKLNPAEAVLPFFKGNILEKLDLPDEAAAAYRRVLDIDAEHAEARARLAALEAASPPAPVGDLLLARHFPNVTFGNGVQCIGVANMRIAPGACIADDVWLNVCLRAGGVRLSIGTGVLVGRRSVIVPGSYLEIADFTILGPNVFLASGEHRYEGNHLRPIYYNGIIDHGALIVEENCWFGMNSVACGGFRIGYGSVVGANAVVRGDIPPFAVAAGAPARIVRLFNPESGVWEPVRSDADKERIEAARRRVPLPTREAYATQLRRGGDSVVDPIVAGREQHLL